MPAVKGSAVTEKPETPLGPTLVQLAPLLVEVAKPPFCVEA